RAARFFLVAALLRAFGEPIRDFIERRLGLVFTVFCVLLIGGLYAVKFL
ncbi:DedA family protein, partial [Escherichia coli]|nr:DedA family protein [Escherichia coli]